MATPKSYTATQEQTGKEVAEKWQQQSVPLTRKPKRIIEQQSESEVAPCETQPALF